MTEPHVSYPLREVLARIEGKVDENTKAIHKLELMAARSSATAVAEVADSAASLAAAGVGRARWALWIAAGSGPASAVLTYLLTRH